MKRDAIQTPFQKGYTLTRIRIKYKRNQWLLINLLLCITLSFKSYCAKNFSYMSSKSGRNFGHVCLLSADSSVRFSSLWLRWWERDDKIIFRVIWLFFVEDIMIILIYSYLYYWCWNILSVATILWKNEWNSLASR